MKYFEKYLKFTRIKINILGNGISSTHSFIKLIFLSAFLTLFTGCIYGKAAIQVKVNNKQSLLNISVANVQVINHQIIITGTGLSRVTAFKIKNGASTTDLQIESKTNTSIVANTLSNVSFAVGTIFDFVLSNANAASTFQVNFINTNNSITAAMLTSMGATKGQVMKYNGASWVASSITNAQTYLGTWDATANNPDLTLPSSMPGDYYIVSVAGTFNSVSYAVGDWIISDGYNWQKVANSAVVVSTFNGRRGIVTLVPTDYVSLRNGSGKLPGSSLNDLDDLNIVTPANGSVLKYDTATSKWIVGVDNSGTGAYTGTPSKAVATDGAGALTTSTTTAAELGYVAGVTSSIQTQLGAKLGTALANGNVFVGNGSGVATAVSLSGDATLLNTGVITLKNTGTAGTYTSVTTDAQGRVTSGSNPAVAAITTLTGDVTASGAGSVTATIAANAVTTGKINDGTILPSDLDFTGTNIGTSGLVIRNLTGGFTPLVCGTVGYVPTWTVTGFTCQAITPGSSLSSLTAATANNTVDNLNFSQVWNWTTATTESLMTFASNALTTGSILNLTTSNGSVNSTNGLLSVANTGASTSGVLARFQANSTAGSGMTMLTNGNVGVGTLAPGSALDVKGTLRLSGSTSGYVGFAPAAAAGTITYTLPSTQGSAGQFLATDGVASTPTLTWASPAGAGTVTSVTSANADIAIATTTSTPVLTLNSGTGANQIVKLNASSQLPAVDGSLLTSLNPSNFSAIVPMDKGGTGANITPVNGGVIYSNATSMASTSAGTTGQILRSAGAAAPVWSTATYPSTVGVNNLLFGSAANVVGEITTANSSVLTTNGSGVPAWTTVANTKTLLGLGTAATKDTGVTSGTIPILGTVTAGVSMCTNSIAGFDCNTPVPSVGSLSQLTAATATNTIDNLNFAQAWNWSTATTQSLMTLASNALTTGSILNLSTSNGSVNSTNGLLNVANTGASTSGVLARFQANSTAGSGMTMLANGNVGIGTTTPNYTLQIVGTAYSNSGFISRTEGFRVNSGSANYGALHLDAPNGGAGRIAFANGQSNAAWDTFLVRTGVNELTLSSDAAAGAAALNVTGSANFATTTGNVGIGTSSPAHRLDVNGNIRVNNKITSASTETILEQTGDALGTTRLRLQNRTGLNGALFENAALDLVDFGFLGSSGAQSNLRYEHRGIGLLNSNNTDGEFQFRYGTQGGSAGTSYFASGPNATIISSGNVGVGTTEPGYKLHVVGAGGATVGYFSDGTATCSITPATAGNISCSSDERLKKNIEFFSDLRSLDKILKLKTVTYEWKDIDNGRHTGFIAQDVEKIAPEFVINGKDGFKQVSYAGFIPWITGAIKALYGEVKIVVARVLSLEEKDAAKERAIASINAKAIKLESDNEKIKKKFEAENLTLKKNFEALKKENELMKAKLDKIEKFLEKNK